jgi:hypothetical protein
MKKVIMFVVFCALFITALNFFAPVISHAQGVTEDGPVIADIERQISELQAIVETLENQVSFLKRTSSVGSPYSNIASVLSAITSPTPFITATDLNSDNTINVKDVKIILSSWGDCEGQNNCEADLNNDNTVDNIDLDILLKNWSR